MVQIHDEQRSIQITILHIYIHTQKLLRQALWLQIMEARTVSVCLNQTHHKWEEAATMLTVQITITCTKRREREDGHPSINTTDNGKEIFQC